MSRVFLFVAVAATLLAFAGDDLKRKQLGKHPERVNGVSFSPDGVWVASASNDNKVMIWDAKTREPVKEIMCHSVGVTDVVFTSDHSVMVTSGNDKLIRFWDTKNWKRLGEISEHEGQVNDLALTADDQFLYSCSDDKTIVKWNMKDRTKVRKIGSHDSRVLSINLGAKDRYLVSTSGDKMSKAAGNLKVWDLESGETVYTHQDEEYGIQTACFNATGSLVFFGGNFSEIKVIKRSVGSVLMSKEVTKFGINSLVVEGTTVYAGTTFDGQLIQWPITSDEATSIKAHNQDVNQIALIGNQLVSGGTDGKVLLWELSK